ncbi:MAG: thiamine phosphate synthase [Acetobacteraceae bacterium]|nr:thiamine phosphate synthase [Acetobacteraceae bacterium]
MIAAARRCRAAAGVPRLILLSDPRRLPDPRAAAERLPRGAAVLARGLPPTALAGLARLCRRRGLLLLVGGDGRAALGHRAGLHVPDRAPVRGLLPVLLRRRGRRPPPLSCAAHGRAGIGRARRLRADWILLSPAFPTGSHPGAPALGPLRWAALARAAGRPCVALGGVSAATAGRLPPRRMAGLAAIGAWL